MSRNKKKLALAAFLIAATPMMAPPAFALRSGHDIVCNTDAFSFDTWFYKMFYC